MEMKDKAIGAKPSEFGPWNPGLDSSIPREVLPLSTMFRTENVETDFNTAHELSDFSGLSPFDIVVFRPERLVAHSLLIRVTITLSVPDGPDYEELGINLRGMVRCLFENHVEPEMADLKALHEEVRQQATAVISEDLTKLKSSGGFSSSSSSSSSSSPLAAAAAFVVEAVVWHEAGKEGLL